MEYDLETQFTEELKETVKSVSLKAKLVAIKNMVVQRLALENEFKLQAANLQTKYEDLYKPIYESRLKTVTGDIEPTYDETNKTWEVKNSTSNNEEGKPRGIEDFWLNCILHNSSFSKLVNDKDRKVLKKLTNIKVEQQQGFDFTLSFYFSQNEFFDHPVLSRTFTFDNKKAAVEKIVSTNIEWKNDDVNPGIEKKKKKIKKGKETKVITKVTEVPCFFTFFKSYDLKELQKKDEKKEGKEDDDEGEEAEGEAEDIINDELDLGNQFRDEIIPYAIEYYLDVVGGDDMDDEFEEEEEEEEVEEKKKGGKKHGGRKKSE